MSRTLNENLEGFSHLLYKYDSLTPPVLAPILSIMKIGSFGTLILLNELKDILRENR